MIGEVQKEKNLFNSFLAYHYTKVKITPIIGQTIFKK